MHGSRALALLLFPLTLWAHAPAQPVPVVSSSPWQIVKEPGAEAAFEIDHQKPHSGGASGRLTIARAGSHEVGLLQVFGAETYRGKRVLLTAWLHSDLSSGDATLALIVNSGTRGATLCTSESALTGQSVWQKLVLSCDVPAGATLLSMGAWVRHGAGTVWLDDVTFDLADSLAPGTAMPPVSTPRALVPLAKEQMAKLADTTRAASPGPTDLGFEQ